VAADRVDCRRHRRCGSGLNGIRRAVEEVKSGNFIAGDDPNRSGVHGELRTLVTELAETQRSIDAAYTNWNPETLRMILARQLPDTQIMVVSNREPYIHNRKDEGIALQVPASGLVAAIEPVMRACGGTWIAHGSGSADRETVDQRDRMRVPPDSPLYTLRRVWLSEAEQEGYYYGLANEGLWPLCHIAFVRPSFRESDWRQYKAVNERFADAVAEEATRPPRSGLSFRAAAEVDPRAAAGSNNRHLLAHSLAQFGSVRHLSLEGGNHIGPAGLDRTRFPYEVSLQ
jgi:trehalose 6-phosphate synthase